MSEIGGSRRARRPGTTLRRLRRLAIRAGRLEESIFRRPALSGAILVVLTLLAALGATRLRIDNRIDVWTTPGDTGASWSRDSERDFVAVVRRGVDPWTEEFLETDRRLSERLEEVVAVKGVESISTTLSSLGLGSLSDLGDGVRFFRGYLLASLHRDDHDDDRLDDAMIRIWVDPGAEARRVVAGVRKAIADEGMDDAILLGPAVFNATLDERSRSETERVFPIALFTVLAVLVLVLRSVRTALALTAAAMLTVVWFLGVCGWSGVRLNFVTTNVPVIGLVVTLALLMHPVFTWRRLRGRGLRTGVLRRVAYRTFPGCFLSAATSATGFAALGLGPVSAVRQFGMLSAVAVLLAFAVATLTFPLTVILLERSGRRGDARPWPPPEVFLRSLGRLERAAQAATGILIVLAALSLVAITTVDIDHRPLEFLPVDAPLYRDYQAAGEEFGGLAPLEIILSLSGPWWETERLRGLERAVEAMSRAAGTRHALSIVEPVKLAASLLAGGSDGSFGLPRHDLALTAAATAVRSSRASLENLVDTDGRRCRVVLPLALIGGRDFQTVRERVLRSLEAFPGIAGSPAGVIDRLMRVQDRILRGQVTSLLAVIAGVSALLGMVLGSWRQARAALLVNLFPLVLIAATMGALGLPLDLSTAMVASVALGIAADDTAHLLWVSRRRKRGAALAGAFASVGPAILATSLVLAAGFAALGYADFPPVARFGLLTSGTLILSLVFHLGVLPILLEERDAGGPESRPGKTPCPGLIHSAGG